MTRSLPRPVGTYFSAATPTEIADCFSEDAIVTDERRTRHGRTEILKWRQEVGKISFRQEILSSMQNGRQVKVTCRVSGDFKGSPVELDYVFEVSGERISNLEIT